MNIKVTHDKQRCRFYTIIEGNECSVEYERVENGHSTINIYRTFVHPTLRGKKIAESLLKAACDYAGEQGISVFPSCSYAVLYFRRHPEYAALLAKGVDLENGGSCRVGDRPAATG